MKLKRISVLGQNFDIHKKQQPIHPEMNGVIGLCFFEEKKIVIDKELSKDTYEKTLYHEIFHAALERGGLRQVLSHEIQEILCELFANIAHDNFNLKKVKRNVSNNNK